jgi:O-antigen/teichoic acid export membrane protein
MTPDTSSATVSTRASVLAKLAANTSWLFLERAISLAVALSVGLYFTRYLGPDNYGLYSYALGLYGLFAVVTRLGINALVVNETVRDSANQARIIGSAFLLRFGASVVAILVLNIVAYFLMGQDITRSMTVVFSIALLFGPFETVTHWFEANVAMKPMAIARSVTTMSIGGLRLALLLNQASLFWFVWLIPAETALAAVFFLLAYRSDGLSVRQWRPDVAILKGYVREGTPLFLSTVAAVLYMKVDQVMLGKMTTPRDVGVYAAAVKISEMLYFVPMILSGLLFPYLIRFKRRGEDLFSQAFQLMCDGFAWMAVGIAIVFTLFSEQIVRLAYGSSYSDSAHILVIHVWAGVFVALETLRSRWFVIQQNTRYQLLTMTAGAVANVGLNLILIPRYQGYGAAIATTVSYAIAVVLSCFFSKSMWGLGVTMLKSLLAPLRIRGSLYRYKVLKAATDRTGD